VDVFELNKFALARHPHRSVPSPVVTLLSALRSYQPNNLPNQYLLKSS
jgi:hypothetical protein